jgi:peptide/nickel transport system permease protein
VDRQVTALRAVARRLGAGLVVLWVAATAAYLALLAAPGDTVDNIVADGADTPQIRAEIIAEWGLDRPAVVQYLDYLGRLGGGDLGRSYLLQRPVTEVIGEQLAPSLRLAVAAAGLGVLLALLIAVATAGDRRQWLRRVSSGTEMLLVSTPSFLIGLLLLSVLSFRFGFFPVSGDQGTAALVLPAVTLALPIAGLLAQVLRDGIDRALDEPFVLTARSRGVRERTVLVRHAFRHAVLPAVSLAGWVFGIVVGGTVIVEQVFGRPGLGQVTLSAVTTRDMPVVLAVVTLSAAGYVVVNTTADLAYLLVDPRLRRS